MPFAKDVFSNQGVQVNVHELEDQIYILVILRFNYFLQHDDVGVTKLL
jgi:hypothetical protein